VQRVISYIPRGVRPFWRGQAIALAAAIVAVVIRAAIDPFVHDGLYFTFLFPAVFMAGLFGGTLAGITTAVVGGTVIAYAWVPPTFSLRVHSDGIIRLVAFCFSAGLTLVLTSFVHRVLDKLAAAEKQAATLAGEMHHRLQNTLTLVQAIAHQAFRNANTLQEARAILMERLAALARAQNPMSEGFGQSVSVQSVVEEAIRPFEPGQFTVKGGPSLILFREEAVSLSLLVHELATNAAKHGALSNSEGRIEISWVEEALSKGCLNWKERFGPEVIEPSRSGFGSKLLATAFPEGKGDVAVSFEQDGVRCKMTFPILGAAA
jgi:two-component sensor histidine kinase